MIKISDRLNPESCVDATPKALNEQRSRGHLGKSYEENRTRRLSGWSALSMA
jgi:hypothetical protein